MSKKINEWFRLNYRNIIIGALVVVPLLVSLISTIHVVNFFQLSNFSWLAITLAVAFEIGALSSLAALAVMDKINKISLWSIFILITIMQMMGNTYYAFDFITIKMQTHPEWTQNWIDLFSIQGESLPATKRILAIVSGAILPIISLTFLHMLISYISKTKPQIEEEYEYITIDENGNEIIELNDNVVVSNNSTNNIIEPLKNQNKLDDNETINKSVDQHSFNDNLLNNEISEPNIQSNINDEPVEINVENNDSTPLESKMELDSSILKNVNQFLKQINPNITENEISQIKEQIEKISNKNDKLQINLGDFLKPQQNKDHTSFNKSEIQLNNPKINQTPLLNLEHNPIKLNDKTNIKPSVHITSNNTALIEPIEIISKPDIENEFVNDDKDELLSETIIEPTITKNLTFDTLPEQIIKEPDNSLESLNGISPQKKKILVYKEKKN